MCHRKKTLACGPLPVNLGAHALGFAADRRSEGIAGCQHSISPWPVFQLGAGGSACGRRKNLKTATILGILTSCGEEVDLVCGRLEGSTELHLVVIRSLRWLWVDSREIRKADMTWV